MSAERQPILVTGGAGFIGSCFVRQWIDGEAAPLVNLDKLTYAGHLASLGTARNQPRHIFVQGDVCDRALLDSLFAQHRPRAIVHFAAETHVDRSIDGPPDFVRTNVVGVVELLEAARHYWQQLAADEQRAFRFLHVSTDEVYGCAGPEEFFRETSPYAPNSPYAASKAAADHFVRAYHRTYGLPAIVTQCSNNYGPFQYPEKLIPMIVCRAIAGRSLPVYGDGQQVRDWLYVDDHAQALRMTLEHGRPGEAYLIGGGEQRTNLEVVQRVCELIDELRPDLRHRPCAQLIERVDDRPGHDRRYAIDFSKIEHELGWRPRHEFDAALRSTVEWYLNSEDWVAQVTRGADATRRQGLGQGSIQDGPRDQAGGKKIASK